MLIPRKAAGDPGTHTLKQRGTQPRLGGRWESPKKGCVRLREGALTERSMYITSKTFN